MNENYPAGNQHRQEPAFYEDEISLTDLLLIVWKYRYQGLLTAIVPVIIAIFYALLANPVYRSEAYLQAPLNRGVEELNVGVNGGQNYTPEKVFSYFVSNLYSRNLRREFFREEGLHAAYYAETPFETVFQNAFNNNLVVEEPKKNEAGPTHIKFSFSDAEKSAQLLNRFIEKVRRFTVTELIDNVHNSVQMRTKFLQEEIVSKRKLMKERREDAIVQLQEALNIARKLDINNPVDFNVLAKSSSNAPGVAVNTDQMPDYARGSIALAAEIEELKNRESDDPFISGLRDMQEELAFLESVRLRPEVIHVVRIDQPAITPEQREKPKRKLIAVIGVVVGGIFGLIVVFGLHFISVFRRELQNKAI